MTEVYDLGIIGSGFAGSLLAMIAKRLGYSVLLLEKGSHPRVVIGESSTPLSNLLLDELASRYDLPAIAPLAKYGSWQRSYPRIACGLKRGFTFHHHSLRGYAAPDPERRDQLLVAASPRDEIGDTHWYRADFDEFLMEQARELGVDYLDQVELTAMHDSGEFVTLDATQRGVSLTLGAEFVVDASGPGGALHKPLRLRNAGLPGYPRTQALYSHFTGVKRLEEGSHSRLTDAPPYPIDDAAVHHIFKGGWVWVLHFNNGVTSAGMAVTEETASNWKLGEGAPAWDRLLAQIPALREQFRAALPIRPFTRIPTLSFRSSRMVGRKWAMLPSAAGFVDPLLSTGFPLTLLGIGQFADILERHWHSPDREQYLYKYAAKTQGNLLATGRLVGALYKSLGTFPLFSALCLLYFSAAVYTETARRMNRPELARSFLLHDHAVFGPACAEICRHVQYAPTERQADQLIQKVLELIEGFNLAGLGDPARRNWYPVDRNVLLDSAWKLGATREEAEQMMLRCGFAA